MQPLDFQRHDLDRMRANNYRALLNLQTGAGKTVEGAFAIKESGARRTLIIAPQQTHVKSWIPTVGEVTGNEPRIIGNGNKAAKSALFDWEIGMTGTFLCTPEFFTRSDVSAWGGDMVIADEAHRIATPKSKSQRKFSGYSAQDGQPMAQRFGGVLLLSGTALRNRFELAWSHSRALWPWLQERGQISYSNFVGWQLQRQEYANVYTSRRDANGNPVAVKQFLAEKIPGQWLSEAPLVITHFKRERCCHFHPQGFLPLDDPTETHERIELLPAQKKAVHEMENMMMTYLDDHPMVSEIPLTKATRIRQLSLAVPTLVPNAEGDFDVTFSEDCKSPHLDRLIDLLTDDFSDEPVMVYTDSQKYAEVVTARLNKAGISAFEFSGRTRATRDADAAQFGSKYRVLVGVLAAIAEGFDGAQHVSRAEIWLSRSLDETINEQAQGRLFRHGQTKQIERVIFHDDLGLSEGRFSEAIEKRLLLNRSLRNG